MPSPTRTLDARTAREFIEVSSFAPATGQRVGLEVEWFTTPSAAPPRVAALRDLLDPLLPLPCGSSLSFEPGGQVEVSTAAFASCGEACKAAATDSEILRRRLAAYGIELFGMGLDPQRPLALATTEPRYVAMHDYLATRWPAGPRMMCTTAAVQVSVDAGTDSEGGRRWRLAHDLGPTLVAAFADSPFADGVPSGWMSTRMYLWLAIDPSRAAPVGGNGDAASAWSSYALAARVMLIRTPAGFIPISKPLSFGRWIDEGHEFGHPTIDDVAYHLTTLFPPVRPRGRLELRMIDMLPHPWWRVPAAVVAALLCDPESAERAALACRPAAGLWREAARSALRHPTLRASAAACFRSALEALDRVGADAVTKEAVAAYAERYVERGRCPAEDRIDLFNNQGMPNAAEVV